MTTTLATRVALDRVAHFLYEEAALLDQRRWFDWMDLFAEGAMYWVPLTPDQPDPINHVSIFYEDAMMREVRARRLEEQRAWSQQPLVNAARIVGNIRLGEAERDGEILVRSTFIMAESRIPFHRQIAGFYTHRLVEHGDSFLIAHKRADIIDSEGVHGNFEGFL
ncbi:MAG TPA: aromatic-ring-hydroxylating dioxygenase subunit beta [Sphingomonas sp.]